MNGALIAYGAAAAGAAVLLLTLELPPVVTQQTGYRGTAIEQVNTARHLRAVEAANQAPAPIDAVDPDGTKASEVFQNVQVLGDLDSAEFTRLMSAITEWVAPEQGCSYCHADGEELSADTLYTKVVARRMLQMTRDLNDQWGAHVAPAGVTCYTCHRGQPVPAARWFTDPGPRTAGGMSGYKNGQNMPAASVGHASLPFDPLSPFLLGDQNIRVVSTTALPAGNRHSIKQTEWTYGLMMHMSGALGVNCTFCHNTRSFSAWDQSTPARATAWYGIRMVRDLNKDYLVPLAGTLPHGRMGPLGDGPKVNCATCHQGAFKPLFGAKLIEGFPELVAPPSGTTSASAAP